MLKWMQNVFICSEQMAKYTTNGKEIEGWLTRCNWKIAAKMVCFLCDDNTNKCGGRDDSGPP